MINLFFGIGNLTRDPDLRYTPQGTPVCKFSIAIDRKFNDKDEVTYLNIVTWSKLAENCAKFLNKGSKVAVVGEIRVNEWEAKDGSKRKDYEINANQVELSELIDCLRSYFNVETNTTYSDHPHDIWHGWDNLIRSLNNASNIAEKLMKQLGYEHD